VLYLINDCQAGLMNNNSEGSDNDQIKILAWYWPLGSEVNHENSIRVAIVVAKLEATTPQIQVENLTAPSACPVLCVSVLYQLLTTHGITYINASSCYVFRQ
jgi:hypothetical protein